MTGRILEAAAGVDLGHVVLIGPMGAGKSTLGALVADRTGRPLLDNDRELTSVEGRTAREIATTDGADALHRAELATLRRMLADTRPSIVTAAASVVVSDLIDVDLRPHRVVYLGGRRQPAAGGTSHRVGIAQRPDIVLSGAEVERRDRHSRRLADLVLEAAWLDAAWSGITAGLRPR